MELLKIFTLSVSSFIVLFLLTKIMGNRQMSQLSMFDYINGITIGSIAAEMATSIEDNFMQPLLAMVTYAALATIASYACTHSIKIRNIITGKSLILMDNGKIYEKNLNKSKLDINEFLVQCRNNGYFDLNNIETAVLEPNGRISFLPKADQRPSTPNDFNLKPNQDKLVSNVIIDGKIMKDNLKYTGNNEKWLKKQMKTLGVSKVEDIFLATCDCNNKLTIYKMTNKEMPLDIFE